MTIIKQVIWITGASSGIGEALVRHYIAQSPDQVQVIASARNEAALIEKFHGDNRVYCLPVDVTCERRLSDAAKQIEGEFGYITHLYLNAGHCEYVDTFPMATASLSSLLAVNLIGAVNTLNVALPLLQAGAIKPMVVAMLSQVVFAPFPRAEFYGASKAAFEYLMKSFRMDAGDSNVDVCLVYPGFVKTPLTDKNDFAMPFLQCPKHAAARIVDAVTKRKRRLIFPKRLYLLLRLSDFFPRLWEKVIMHSSAVNKKG